MNSLLQVLRDIIPTSSTQKWRYDIDLAHSCFRLEHAHVDSASLSGSGHESLTEIATELVVQVTVGTSYHVHRIVLREKSVQSALEALFDFPEKFRVCCECGYVRPVKDDKTVCESCLFLDVFSSLKSPLPPCGGPSLAAGRAACTICLEPAYRTVLPCGHVFHMTCLLSMEPDRIKCPNCRTPLPSNLIRDLFGNVDDEDDD